MTDMDKICDAAEHVGYHQQYQINTFPVTQFLHRFLQRQKIGCEKFFRLQNRRLADGYPIFADLKFFQVIEQDILSKYSDAPEEKGAGSAVTDEPTIKLPPVDGSAIPSDFRLSLDELKFGRNYSGDK